MSTRFDNRVDSNQADIVAAFRHLGASVITMQMAKGGFPDLVVLIGSFVVLVEVKSDKGRLTKAQVEWFNKYGDYAHIVKTVEEVVELYKFYKEQSEAFDCKPLKERMGK